MFKLPQKSFVNKVIDKDNLFKILYNNENLDKDCNSVKDIKITNILNSNNIKEKSNGFFKEIYVVRISLTSYNIPNKFFKKFDSYINIPTLYIFANRGFENYVLSIKTEKEAANELNRIFISGWGNRLSLAIPRSECFEDIFYYMIEKFTNLKFLENENYKSYTQRLISTYKEDKDIRKGFRNYDFVVGSEINSNHVNGQLARFLHNNLFTFYFDKDCINENAVNKFNNVMHSELKSNNLKRYYKKSFPRVYKGLINNSEQQEIKEALLSTIDITFGMQNRILKLKICADDFLYKLGVIMINGCGNFERTIDENGNIKAIRIKKQEITFEPVRTQMSQEEIEKMRKQPRKVKLNTDVNEIFK